MLSNKLANKTFQNCFDDETSEQLGRNPSSLRNKGVPAAYITSMFVSGNPPIGVSHVASVSNSWLVWPSPPLRRYNRTLDLYLKFRSAKGALSSPNSNPGLSNFIKSVRRFFSLHTLVGLGPLSHIASNLVLSSVIIHKSYIYILHNLHPYMWTCVQI